MGARSFPTVSNHPWPAVFEAFTNTLPVNGFTIVSTDPAAGRIHAETRRDRITISTGAIDAITTEWVVDVESKLGIGPTSHEDTIARLSEAVSLHLITYYGT